MPCPQSTALSKLNVFISLLALALYCVGGAISQWIKAKFVLPVTPPVNLDVHMGLTESCRKATVMGNVISDKCGMEGARDWQKAATGLAIVGAVAGVVGLIFAVLNLTVSKVAGRRWIKLAVVACSLASAGFMAGALALYGTNKKIQVRPPLPLEVDFDIGWAFIVSAASAGLYVILTLLALADTCCTPDRRGEFHRTNKTEEATIHFTNSVVS
ncbi:hypothetical protein ElyMa_002481000 [Elysia marginata]|uniref:Claudin n=1 Tax=Elysia marginata TaxID=1093978 RepID=A0AAV4GN68_9GAST|nr:hypothetical protein ElyMa_002481000 [Elysia marginata]